MMIINVPSVPCLSLLDSAMCEAIRQNDPLLIRFISREPIKPRPVFARLGTILVWK